jgi:hypothetical protein
MEDVPQNSALLENKGTIEPNTSTHFENRTIKEEEESMDLEG